jgi:C1A family cysteine protease
MSSSLILCAVALLALAVTAEARPAKESPAEPSSVDLRPKFEKWGLDRRRQGPRGTCSVFTVTGALEYALAKRANRGTRLSVEFLNWAGHKAANRTADGGFFSELWDGYEAYGIATEADLPYREAYDADLQPQDAVLHHAKEAAGKKLKIHWIKEWNPETGLTDAHETAIKAALRKGFPVCGGFRWPKKEAWDGETLKMCPPEEVFDGHSVLLVGYTDDAALPGGGAFLIRNSGGEGKDGRMPYEYVRAYMNDAAWIE